MFCRRLIKAKFCCFVLLFIDGLEYTIVRWIRELNWTSVAWWAEWFCCPRWVHRNNCSWNVIHLYIILFRIQGFQMFRYDFIIWYIFHVWSQMSNFISSLHYNIEVLLVLIHPFILAHGDVQYDGFLFYEDNVES